MLTNQNIKLDFVQRGLCQQVYVVQGDCLSRSISFSLYENGTPWEVPEGVTPALRYGKSDGTGGVYDTLPDGNSAWTMEGNAVNMILAPQVMSVPGLVQCQLMLAQGEVILGTFSFHIIVESDPAYDVVESEGYFNWSNVLGEPVIVTVDAGANTASHSPAEIRAHLEKGEEVLMFFSLWVLRPTAANRNSAVFREVHVSDGIASSTEVTIHADKSFTWTVNTVNATDDRIKSVMDAYRLEKPMTLTVEIVDDVYASHDWEEIRTCYNNGWNVQLAVDNRFVMLDRISVGTACFVDAYNTVADGEEVLRIDEYTIAAGKFWSKASRTIGTEKDQGRGITSLTGNADGSWTVTYTDGTTETISSEAYAAMAAQLAQLSLEIADKEQLAPEFANSVEECTDTSKLYVLPDGYIYAYMAKTGELFTNQVANAVNADGTPFNGGLGYMPESRLHANSAGVGATFNGLTADGTEQTIGSRNNCLVVGLIPFDPAKNKVIRISGFSGDHILDSDDYLYFYKADGTGFEQRGRIKYYVNDYAQSYTGEPAFDGAVNTFTFDFDALKTKTPYYSGLITQNAAYFAVSMVGYDLEHLVVTVDEEIVFGTASAWTSTAHAFVPADCEDRIIPLEETAENHEGRIKTLEYYGANASVSGDIPAYIKTECDDVLSRVMDCQENRTFNLIAISDFHYGGTGDNKNNLIRACKAISYMTGRIHVDAIATLGDNVPFGAGGDENIKTAHRWFKEINEILAITQQPGIVEFRTPGNHDRLGGNDSDGNATSFMPDGAIYRYISGYNRQCEAVDVPGGWGYHDFTPYKLRVIVANTCEVEGQARFSEYSGYRMSSKQLNWIADALVLSEKPDAEEWQILLLSHCRADDWQEPATGTEWAENSYILPNILNAYRNGSSYSAVREDGTTVSCDFTGKNQAKLIGQIHGHHHSYTYGALHLGPASNSDATDIIAIGTPTSALGSDHNADNDGNCYGGAADTAEETAFCVYCIDLDKHTIHAIHYGAGIDREISY